MTQNYITIEFIIGSTNPHMILDMYIDFAYTYVFEIVANKNVT